MAVIVEDAGGVRVITLNRPEVMNALNAAMRAGVRMALEGAAGRARVVVLTGTGRAFCAGQDLADAGPAATFDLEAVLNEEYVPLLRAIRDCPLPVIAAVNGVAAGAGANLALACDVVVAADAATADRLQGQWMNDAADAAVRLETWPLAADSAAAIAAACRKALILRRGRG